MKLKINDKVIDLALGGLLRRVARTLFTHDAVKLGDDGKWEKKREHRSVWKLYVAVAFSFFILEESIQMVTFSTFPLQDVRDYSRISGRADWIRKGAQAGRILNYTVGWINPIMMYAYGMFWQASDLYADSLDVLVAVNGGIQPDRDVVTMSGSGPKATDLMNNNITSTAGVVVPLDLANLSSVVIGMPTWSDAPAISGAHVIRSASDLPAIMELVGFNRTLVVPITAIDPRAAVINAKTPFLFNITAFPKNPICYEVLKCLQDYWVVVNGEVASYNGAPQIILWSPNQLIAVQSMAPGSPVIPFEEFYKTITGGG